LATWDVFHSDRLEVERALSTAAVRAALARGDLREDDLARPAGTTTPWARLADLPALADPVSEATPAAIEMEDEPPLLEKATDEVPILKSPPRTEPAADESLIAEPVEEEAEEVLEALIDEDEDEDEDEEDERENKAFPTFDDIRPATTEDLDPPALRDDAYGHSEFDLELESGSRVALPAIADAEDDLGWAPEEGEEFDPLEEDEEAAEFSLSRSAATRVEELDLAAMVDVAFQMVLFFMVTATTILYKTLEVPKTNPDAPPSAVAQGQQRKTLEDMQNDFIVVEINPQGEIRVDQEPASASSLIERLRKARKDTGRNSMLLSADFATPHRNAVLAYDAANEIGLKIAIAKPAPPGSAPPPPAKKAGTG
jgi:biopolymer transport protein ExbD